MTTIAKYIKPSFLHRRQYSHTDTFDKPIQKILANISADRQPSVAHTVTVLSKMKLKTCRLDIRLYWNWVTGKLMWKCEKTVMKN